MKKKVVGGIKRELEDLLGCEVWLVDPDWDKPVQFPVVWMEVSGEESREGVQQPYTREMSLEIFVAERTVRERVEEVVGRVLDWVEKVDSWSQGSMVVSGRTVRMRYRGMRTRTMRSEQDFIVMIAGVQVSVIYDGR